MPSSSLKTIFGILGLGLCAVFLQGVILKGFLPTLVVPNLIVIIIVFLSFHRSSILGVILSFLLGLELDLFSNPALLGPYAAASVAVFALVSTISRRLFLDSFVTVFIAVFLGALFYELVYFIVVSEFIALKMSFLDFVHTGLVEAFFSALLAPLFFRLFSGIRISGGMRAAMV